MFKLTVLPAVKNRLSTTATKQGADEGGKCLSDPVGHTQNRRALILAVRTMADLMEQSKLRLEDLAATTTTTTSTHPVKEKLGGDDALTEKLLPKEDDPLDQPEVEDTQQVTSGTEDDDAESELPSEGTSPGSDPNPASETSKSQEITVDDKAGDNVTDEKLLPENEALEETTVEEPQGVTNGTPIDTADESELPAPSSLSSYAEHEEASKASLSQEVTVGESPAADVTGKLLPGNGSVVDQKMEDPQEMAADEQLLEDTPAEEKKEDEPAVPSDESTAIKSNQVNEISDVPCCEPKSNMETEPMTAVDDCDIVASETTADVQIEVSHAHDEKEPAVPSDESTAIKSNQVNEISDVPCCEPETIVETEPVSAVGVCDIAAETTADVPIEVSDDTSGPALKSEAIVSSETPDSTAGSEKNSEESTFRDDASQGAEPDVVRPDPPSENSGDDPPMLHMATPEELSGHHDTSEDAVAKESKVSGSRDPPPDPPQVVVTRDDSNDDDETETQKEDEIATKGIKETQPEIPVEKSIALPLSHATTTNETNPEQEAGSSRFTDSSYFEEEIIDETEYSYEEYEEIVADDEEEYFEYVDEILDELEEDGSDNFTEETYNSQDVKDGAFVTNGEKPIRPRIKCSNSRASLASSTKLRHPVIKSAAEKALEEEAARKMAEAEETENYMEFRLKRKNSFTQKDFDFLRRLQEEEEEHIRQEEEREQQRIAKQEEEARRKAEEAAALIALQEREELRRRLVEEEAKRKAAEAEAFRLAAEAAKREKEAAEKARREAEEGEKKEREEKKRAMEEEVRALETKLAEAKLAALEAKKKQLEEKKRLKAQVEARRKAKKEKKAAEEKSRKEPPTPAPAPMSPTPAALSPVPDPVTPKRLILSPQRLPVAPMSPKPSPAPISPWRSPQKASVSPRKPISAVPAPVLAPTPDPESPTPSLSASKQVPELTSDSAPDTEKKIISPWRSPQKAPVSPRKPISAVPAPVLAPTLDPEPPTPSLSASKQVPESTSVSAPDTEKKKNNSVYYSVNDLRKMIIPGLDYKNREIYLSPADFQTLFEMSREEFDTLPKWKRTNMKRKQKLF